MATPRRSFTDEFKVLHNLREVRAGKDRGRRARLWTFSGTTAWRHGAVVL